MGRGTQVPQGSTESPVHQIALRLPLPQVCTRTGTHTHVQRQTHRCEYAPGNATASWGRRDGAREQGVLQASAHLDHEVSLALALEMKKARDGTGEPPAALT